MAVEEAVSAAAAAPPSSPSPASPAPRAGLGAPGSLAAATAAAGDPSARLARLAQLQADHAAARSELESVTTVLRRDVAAFEDDRGEPFLYQGRRLAEEL